MLIKTFLLFLVATAATINGIAQIYLTDDGEAVFVSDAPLEFITATSNQVQGAINVTDKQYAFKIDNRTFIGFNSPLQQEHFYENYMEVDKYKYSTFQGKIIEDIDPQKRGPQPVRAKGILSIHGVDTERIIPASLEFSEGKILIHSEFDILLEDHNIRIPNVVHQKIAEVIKVKVSASLKEKKD